MIDDEPWYRGRVRKFRDREIKEVLFLSGGGLTRREIATELELTYEQVMYIQKKYSRNLPAERPWLGWDEAYKLAACRPWRSE